MHGQEHKNGVVFPLAKNLPLATLSLLGIHAALNQKAAARPKPNSPLAPAAVPPKSQPNVGWSFAKYNSKYSRPVKICAVSGPHDPLSNFYAFSFWHRGVLHKSLEHTYHLEKAQFLGNLQARHEILAAPDAHGANDKSKRYFKSWSLKIACMSDSRLARSQKERHEMKETVVLRLLREKFKQCKVFSSALQDSGSKELVHNVLDP